jgi:hypothetical protein
VVAEFGEFAIGHFLVKVAIASMDNQGGDQLNSIQTGAFVDGTDGRQP